MKKVCLITLVTFALSCACTMADTFRVTTLRAAPGLLEQLITDVKGYREYKSGKVIVMRHSQGDHWDLLLLEPAGNDVGVGEDFGDVVNFQHGFIASSDSSFSQLRKEAQSNDLYHIEMFHAVAGKKQALLDQRNRENQYLQATGQTTNAVFSTDFGSDVDVFTIGFHTDLTAFAKGPTVSDADAELAARKAGFRNRADLGYYLRSLLTSHQDTLAVPVPD